MKIAYVSDAIYPYNKGGKEKRLYELSTRLAKMGHDVHIYTMHWWDESETTRVENGVTLHAICKLHNMYNGETRSIKEALLFSLACLKLFNVKADIYDVDHMPFFPIYTSWLALKLRGRKLHGTWHEALSRKDWTDYMGAAGNIAYVIQNVSIRLPYHITAASKHTQQLIQTKFGRPNKVDLVASGIDSALLRSLKPAKITCDVLYVGRFVKDKNLDVLIKSIAIIAKEKPSIRCIIIGHGIEQPRLSRLIKQLKLTKQVSLLEPLSQAIDIYSYMKAAKVFCLPSVREGFGIAALEALGCGTPVVTVDSPANAAKALIDDGKNGSVVALKPAALASALSHWLSSPKPRNIAANVNNYDWEALAVRQAEVYES